MWHFSYDGVRFQNLLYINLIISSFNQHHKPGQTVSKFLYFGYADRCNAVVAGQENKAELFQRFFSQDFSNPEIKILRQQFLNSKIKIPAAHQNRTSEL
jgi:hypothetical protein